MAGPLVIGQFAVMGMGVTDVMIAGNAGTADLAAVARAAHRLKGASGVIGAAALCELAEAIEKAAAADDRPGVRRLGGALREEVRRVADQVRAERSAVVRA